MSTALPHSLEAERAVLGGILLRGSKLSEISSIVEPNDFYHPAHQMILESMLHVERSGSAIDPLTVCADLSAKERLEKVRGGEAYLVELLNEVPTAENLDHYARIVAQRARQRDLVRLCAETASRARTDCDSQELLASVEQAVFKLAGSYALEQTVSLKAVIADGISRLERRKNGEHDGIPTGFPDLDAVWGGLHSDDLIILAARPRMGKSAMAIALLINAAKSGHPGLMFSVEMGQAQLGDRVLSAGGKVPLSKIRSGKPDVSDWRRLTSGMAELINLPIEIDFSGELTVQAIRARTRRWSSRIKRRGIVVVDYLQLVRLGGRRRESRELEVGEIAQNLKMLAKEVHMPIVALAQVNRECEKRQDKRPTLADLRESGSIEAHSDIVAALYRDEVYDNHTLRRGTAELITLKHRQGPEGTVELAWKGEFTLFESMERDREWRPNNDEEAP